MKSIFEKELEGKIFCGHVDCSIQQCNAKFWIRIDDVHSAQQKALQEFERWLDIAGLDRGSPSKAKIRSMIKKCFGEVERK